VALTRLSHTGPRMPLDVDSSLKNVRSSLKDVHTGPRMPLEGNSVVTDVQFSNYVRL